MVTESSHAPVRVLLVEDDEDDYLLTRDLFEELGGDYRLDWTSEFDAALKSMCRGDHDVYLVDYRLGARTGLELLNEARESACLGPVILLTGLGEREIDLKATEAGAADYLEKGRLDASLLERSIRYALMHWRYQTELEQRVRERTAELSDANEALRQREEQLRDADRKKDEFLAMLAHELRNPLAPIRTGLEFLKRADANKSLSEEVRGVMERQIQQMVRLIDDLLDVSRITQGKLDLRLRRASLAEIIESAVEASRPFIEEAGHELVVEPPHPRLHLEADPNRLAQVFSNILNNAARYTQEGGRIAIAARRDGSDALVTVSDNGIGITPEMLGRIFDMFAQADGSRERSGTGLGIGLTLVRSLVERHGGSVEVQSGGHGQGSEFQVRLPLAEPAAEPLEPAKTAAPPKTAGSLRILVVDDNQPACDMLRLLLQMMGHEVEAAADGAAAVERAEEFRPEVVLMDIGMPKLNGYDAARRIREQPWGAAMTLVALTGWGQQEDKQRALDAGFDRHLVKPVEPGALESLLGELAQSFA